MDNAYSNAAFAANLPGLTKLVLLGMICHRNNDSGRVWIGQENLAKELGVSPKTVQRGIDALERLGILQQVGEQPLNPSCVGRFTKIYLINLSPLKRLGASQGTNPTALPPPEATNHEDWRSERPTNYMESSSPSGAEGVAVVVARGGVEEAHTHTYANADAAPHKNDTNKNNSNTSGASLPNPQQGLRPSNPVGEDFSPSPEPHPGTLREGRIKEVPAAVLSGDDTSLLARIFNEIAPAPDDNPFPALDDYKGPLSAARLAVLMFWAFTVSNYWSKEENWHVLDMENFLGASRTLDKQFNPEQWRQHDGLVKKFPTAQAVMDFFIPPPVHDFTPEEVCEDGQHIWVDVLHTAQRCSVCGMYRTNPMVTRWTAADDLEAEYMELVESCEVYESDLYPTGSWEPTLSSQTYALSQ